jgi:hypothetical protein
MPTKPKSNRISAAADNQKTTTQPRDQRLHWTRRGRVWGNPLDLRCYALCLRLGLAMLAAVPLLALAAAGTAAQYTFTYLNGLAPAA